MKRSHQLLATLAVFALEFFPGMTLAQSLSRALEQTQQAYGTALGGVSGSSLWLSALIAAVVCFSILWGALRIIPRLRGLGASLDTHIKRDFLWAVVCMLSLFLSPVGMFFMCKAFFIALTSHPSTASAENVANGLQ